MTTVTIPQKEYRMLKQQSVAYKKLTTQIFDAVVKDDITTVVDDFRKTELYTPEFLLDLEHGLAKSSYGSKS
jgi:hypothetical protein